MRLCSNSIVQDLHSLPAISWFVVKRDGVTSRLVSHTLISRPWIIAFWYSPLVSRSDCALDPLSSSGVCFTLDLSLQVCTSCYRCNIWRRSRLHENTRIRSFPSFFFLFFFTNNKLSYDGNCRNFVIYKYWIRHIYDTIDQKKWYIRQGQSKRERHIFYLCNIMLHLSQIKQ